MRNFNFLRFLIYSTIILSPLYGLRFKIFGFPTTLLEVLIIFVFLLFLFEKLKSGDYNPFKFFSQTAFDLPIFFLLCAVIISLFTSSDLRGGLGIFKAYFLEPAIFYYIVVSLFSREKNILPLVSPLVLASIWLSLLAILQAITGRFSFAPHELAQGRMVAVYNSANALGLFLGPIFSFLLGLVLLDGQKLIKKKNYILLFSMTCFLIAPVLILTQSRGTLFALLGVIFFIIYFFLTKTSLLRCLLFSGLIIILVIFSIFSVAFLKVGGDLTPPVFQGSYRGQDTLQIRFYLWEGTFGLLLNRPFFGAGLDSFKEIYFGDYSLPQYREPLQYPHNLFLTLFAELGILGLLAFAFLVWRIIRALAKIGPWGISIACVLIYLFIHGLVDVPYFKNDLSFQFFLFLAFVQIVGSKKASL
jgi:O-antigen ligase